LYGTIHIVPKSDLKFGASLKNLINQCDVLVLETDVKLPIGEQIRVAKLTFLPDGNTIKHYISDAEYNRYEKWMKDSMKLSDGDFKKHLRFKPFFSYSLLLTQKLGRIKSYDQEIYSYAMKKNLKFEKLESIEYQLAVIDSFSIKQQFDMLSFGNVMDEYNQMLDVYNNGDIEAMYNQVVEGSQFSDIQKIMLDNRNNNWVPRIVNFITLNPSFIAVGAAHLGGPKGLVAQLRKQGYTLTPVKI